MIAFSGPKLGILLGFLLKTTPISECASVGHALFLSILQILKIWGMWACGTLYTIPATEMFS